MTSEAFRDGDGRSMIEPMYDNGYAAARELVDPEYLDRIYAELKVANAVPNMNSANLGRGPSVEHNPEIDSILGKTPTLREFRDTLNHTITDVSGFQRNHLSYLTVRGCPVESFSSHIHRNDDRSGPWLVAFVLTGSGSIQLYNDDVIGQGEEIALNGDESDPQPMATAQQEVGDGWGAYTKEWSIPHAGGRNAGIGPKVIMLLYGWEARHLYPFKGDPTPEQVPFDWAHHDDAPPEWYDENDDPYIGESHGPFVEEVD